MRTCLPILALGLSLSGCAGPSGIKGNDTGGIIPWSPDNQRHARAIAQENCAAYGKQARIVSNDRIYGGMIGYRCRFVRGGLRRP